MSTTFVSETAARYYGPDRRVRPRAVDRACWVWALLVFVAPVVGYGTAPGDRQSATVFVTIALTLAIVLGLVARVSTRALGDHRVMTVGLGLVTLTVGPVLLAGFRASVPGESAVPNALVAALPTLVLLAIVPFRGPIDTRTRQRRGALSVMAASSVLAIAVAAQWPRQLIGALQNTAVRLLSDRALVVLAGFCVVLTVSYVMRGIRASSNALVAFGLVSLAGGAACLVAAAGGPRATGVAWLTFSVGALGATHVIVRALLRAHRDERRQVLAALSQAEVLRASRRESNESRANVHELRSGLLVLEGAMRCLAEQPGVDTELAAAVGAEIVRLRALLDPSRTRTPAEHFELADALSPVVTCARASGMTVRDRFDADLAVTGDPFVAAQVVHGLLANAVRHAPGSPVDVTCQREGAEVVVQVADHGPGLAAEVRGRVFEADVRNAAGGGDGLGLWVAGQLVESQRGRIGVVERSDGVTFELRLPAMAGV